MKNAMWNIPAITGIPNSYMPQASQIPPFIRSAEDLRRWCVCFALTRQHVGYDSPTFARALYASDVPTDAPVPA